MYYCLVLTMQELKLKNKKITEERQKIWGINDYFSASLHFLTFLFQWQKSCCLRFSWIACITY